MGDGNCLLGADISGGVGRFQVARAINGLAAEEVSLAGFWRGENGAACPERPGIIAFDLIVVANVADPGVGVAAGRGDEVGVLGEGVNGRYR